MSGIRLPGFCRKKNPGAYTVKDEKGEAYAIGIQPITDADEGCAEHKEK